MAPGQSEGQESTAQPGSSPVGERSQQVPTWPWARIAAMAGSVVTIVGATVAVTLAATHRSAVRENGIAYVNGRVDGYAAGFNDGALFFTGGDIDDW